MRRIRKAEILIRIILIFLGVELGIRLTEAGYYFYFSKMAERKTKTDESAYRIVCLGESTVRGMEVEPEKSFPAQLSGILKLRYPDKNIKVYNLGVCGITTQRIYKGLEYALNYYDPDLIVLCAGNNLLELPYFLDDARNRYLTHFIVFFNNLKLVRLSRFIFTGIKDYFIGHDEPIFKMMTFTNRDYDWEEPIFATYNAFNPLIANHGKSYKNDMIMSDSNRWLSKIIKKIKNTGHKIIICNYFISWVNHHLKDVAYENGIPFVNNRKIVQRYFEVGKIGELFSKDHWHPNAKGHRLIAENIFETIEKERIISD